MRVLPLGTDPILGAIVTEGFLSRLSFGIVSAAIQLYAIHLGMQLTEIGVLLAVSTVAAMAVKPVMGWVADRFGLKRSFVGAICLRSLVALLLVFAVLPWQLIAIRVIYGVSQGMRDPALNALLAERGGKKKMATGFAWYATAKNTAGAVGGAIAAFLLALLDQTFSLVFLVAFVMSILPLVVVALYVREPEIADQPPAAGTAVRRDQANPRASKGALVREFAFVREFSLQAADEAVSSGSPSIIPVGTWLYPVSGAAHAAAQQEPGAAASPRAAGSAQPQAKAAGDRPRTTLMLATYFGLGAAVSTTAQMLVITILAKEWAHLHDAQLATVYLISAAAVAVSGPLFGWLTDNVSRKLVLSTRGVANTCSSLIIMAFPSLFGISLGYVVDDIGKSAFKPAWGTLMSEVAGQDRARRARTMSYLSIAEDVGDILGPVLLTTIMAFAPTIGLVPVPAALGARVLLAGATELYASRLHRPTDSQTKPGRLKPVEVVSNRRA